MSDYRDIESVDNAVEQSQPGTSNINIETSAPPSPSSVIILDGRFYEIIPEKSSERLVVALCMKCKPKRKEVKGFHNSSSNFRSHLKRAHGSGAIEEYEEYIKSKKQPKETQDAEVGSGSRLRKSGRALPTQSNFEKDITNFIIHSMSPLCVVENPFFKDIFKNLNILDYGLSLMSRRKLGRHIDDLFNKNIQEIKTTLNKVKSVCTTADVWSTRKISFLGVTAHWIASDTLERKSVALACRRFSGTHSYDRIAEYLENIHMEFGLTFPKLTATVTDNGSNFVKAFRMFGVHIKSQYEGGEETDDDDVESGYDDWESCLLLSSEENDITQVSGALNLNPTLPRHIRCFAHTLSLCVTSDATKTIKASPELFAMHSQVMNKCNLLWNAAGRPKTAEIIQNILGHTLSRPGDTRWNSLYDSMNQILELKDKSCALFQALGIKNMIKDNEFLYVKEHIASTRPIAEALDIMQGEKYTYYGLVIPCLLSLQRKHRMLEENEWVYCKPLVESLRRSVETRFEPYLKFDTPEAENAVIATFSHPVFKNKWLSCVDSCQQRERLLSLFKTATAAEIEVLRPPQAAGTEDLENSSNYDFFDFGTVLPFTNSQDMTSRGELLSLQFFADSRQDLISLELFPEIKNIFLRYNTPLPSSAPVERLFSFATMINEPKSNKLSDQTFERRVVLKANLLKLA